MRLLTQLRWYHPDCANRLSQTSSRGGGGSRSLTSGVRASSDPPRHCNRRRINRIRPPRHCSCCCCRDPLVSSRDGPFRPLRHHRPAQRRHRQRGPLIIPSAAAVIFPPPSSSLLRRPNSPCPVSMTWCPNWQSRGTPSRPSWTVSVNHACQWTGIAWICMG
jgi:hypothetical protein